MTDTFKLANGVDDLKGVLARIQSQSGDSDTFIDFRLGEGMRAFIRVHVEDSVARVVYKEMNEHRAPHVVQSAFKEFFKAVNHSDSIDEFFNDPKKATQEAAKQTMFFRAPPLEGSPAEREQNAKNFVQDDANLKRRPSLSMK